MPRAPEPPITILMPCKDQKDDFLAAAIESVVTQTDPGWRLTVITEVETPPAVTERVASFRDERIAVIVSDGRGLGGALNTGMRRAVTEFVCILLSDDMLAPNAVATLHRYVRRYPNVDFFHSSRRYIDASGTLVGPVMHSIRHVSTPDFPTRGSPVKHLLCWRRTTGLAAGGMDEALSAHGCDDFDFPWTMCEAGARFKAVGECLYHYRRHYDAYRLTTHTPLQTQVDTLSAMFRKHGIPEFQTSRYVHRALDDYLLDDALPPGDRRAGPINVSCYSEIRENRKEEFLARGVRERDFFPHRLYFIPKGGPDGLKVASRICGVGDSAQQFEIVLYSLPPAVDEFPDELFFDDDIIWHQQHFGRKGQVATANLVVDGSRVFATVYVSDLVQRISRRREFKTRVEKLFDGWSRMLLNATMAFAIERGASTLLSATSDLALRNTDPTRKPDGRLFSRVYDRHLGEMFSVVREGDWWRMDVAGNSSRVVLPVKHREVMRRRKTICICHDIERGLGHRKAEPRFAQSADASAPAALARMLDIEQVAGARGTYQIVGTLFDELRAQIGRDGHAVAFHSWNHVVPASGLARVTRRLGRWIMQTLRRQARLDSEQLRRCRQVDYRIKGYRPPQSKLTDDVSDELLAFYNFEWLASSAWSFGFTRPRVEHGIVKIPIRFDDFPLHTGRISSDAWVRQVIDTVRESDFTAFGLHDCYASHWLDQYPALLSALRELGEFRTLDEVAAQQFLSSAV